MDETISLKEVLKIIKKRLFLIICFIIFSCGIAAIISFYYLPPIYQAQTQILVNQKSNDPNAYSWTQMEMDLQLINTYNVIIKSPAILTKVIDDLKLNISSDGLSEKISVYNEDNSKVVNISVEDQKPQQAVDIANKVAEVFKEEIPLLMSVDNISILSVSSLDESPSPIKPNKKFNIAIAGVIGLMIGIGLAILLELFDTTIRNENDIRENFDLPIIGFVSPINSDTKKKLKSPK